MGAAMRSDWVEVELHSVLKLSKEKYKPKGKEQAYYIGLEHIEKNTGKLTDQVCIAGISATKNKFRDTQILYGKLRPYLNKVYLSDREGVCSTDILVFDVLPAIKGEYALNFMLSRRFVNDMSANTSGINLPRVSTRYINSYPFPLPPVPEQHKIVAKIEELFSRLDYGISCFKVAQEKLATYRQSVLKRAFECGFANIAIEYKPLSNFAELITKGASPSWQGFSYTSDETQLLYITSENVREGYIDLGKRKYLPYEFNKKQKRSMLQKGDVLFNLVGASIGRSAIYNAERIANINQAVSVIRLKKDLVNQYLNYFLNSDVAKQAYLSKKVDVARANLSLKDVNEIEVPYCSIQDQVKIVKEIKARFSVCDQFQQAIEQGLQKAETLRQSILKKAFEGRLLTEVELADCRAMPEWEPAQQLMARIQSEKSVIAKKAIGDKSRISHGKRNRNLYHP